MHTSTQTTSHKPAWALPLLILSALALLSFGFRTLSSSALWMHLASGRVIAQEGRPHLDPFSYTTTTERPWVNANWLFDKALYQTWEVVGPHGVVVLNAILGLLAFLLALKTSRTPLVHQATALTLLACGWLIAPAFQAGPAIPALFLAGWTMATLHRWGGRPTAWLLLIPSQLLWTNVHVTFFLGPVMALVYAIQAWFANRRSDSTSVVSPGSLFALAATLAAVTLINPYGLGLHRHVLASFTNPSLGVLIEWISPFQSEFVPTWTRHASTLVLILVASGFIFIRDRLPLAPTLFAVAGAFLLVVSSRYVAISSLLVAPFCALSLEGLARVIRQQLGSDHADSFPLARVTAVFLALASLFTLFYVTTNRYYLRTGSASSFGTGVVTEMLPEAACERVISRPDFPARAINIAMDGGYLAWRLPQRKVFTDTRVSVYGASFYQGLARALLGQTESWDNLMKQWEPGAVILNGSWPGAGVALRRLAEDQRWALVYFDGISAILVLRTTENMALISDLKVQASGLADLEQARRALATAKGGLVLQPNSPRLLGAGLTYLALNRFREARTVYHALMKHSPQYNTGWLNLGICELQLRALDQAITCLTTARTQRPDAALAWLWLGKAYAAKGQTAESEAANNKARAINKGIADAFEQGFQPATNRPMPGVLDPNKR